jgi:hypothetical protein
MKIKITFEYDTEHKVSRVLSTLPRPPFGIGEVESVLHDSHFVDAAKKELRHAVNAAIKGDLSAITALRS